MTRFFSRALAISACAMLPAGAHAGLTRVTFDGEFDLAGSGSVLGVVDFDPSAPPENLFALVDVQTGDGSFITTLDDTPIPVAGQRFDVGWETPAAGRQFALWRGSDIDEATILQGDRLLFVDFEAGSGFDAAGGVAQVTEFVCQVADCTGFNDTTGFRTGDVPFSVPEPAGWALMLLGAGTLLLVRRRNNRLELRAGR